MNKRFLKHIQKAKSNTQIFVDSEMSMRLGHSLANRYFQKTRSQAIFNTAKKSYLRETKHRALVAASIGGILGTSAVAVGVYQAKKHKDNRKR